MQFLCELFKKLVKKNKCMGGGGGEVIYKYIKLILSCDFQITLESGNIVGECNF